MMRVIDEFVCDILYLLKLFGCYDFVDKKIIIFVVSFDLFFSEYCVFFLYNDVFGIDIMFDMVLILSCIEFVNKYVDNIVGYEL